MGTAKAEPAGARDHMSLDDRPQVSVFSPLLSLTVTIEPGREGGPDEVHIHPGGQGFWIARMLGHLGERPILCGPIGGESGRVIEGMVGQWGIEMGPVEIPGSSPVSIQDRRSGDRDSIAETEAPSLPRHELDDAYSKFLHHSLSSHVCVITGQTSEIVPVETYRRLGHDLASADVRVVGDLHGAELTAFLKGGPLDLLKVSDEDLAADGLLTTNDEDEALAVLRSLVDLGAKRVVLSRAHRPALAIIDGVTYRATAPAFEPADHRGAGDSMTAGLAVAFRRGLGAEDMLRLGCGAGAANVTRHGLGSAAIELIAKLADRVTVETLTPLGAS
jgi:1-phosphofructokinase